MNDHQKNQIRVINELEELIRQKSESVSAVSPTDDFENDHRITLTSIHKPHDSLKELIQKNIVQSLKSNFPELHFYPDKSLHLTIKNVRVISDPPNFNAEDIKLAEKVFSEVLPRHKSFDVYFYRLLLTQNSIALVGTTDPELDEIIFDLDQKLAEADLADDKKYANTKHFFSNITLARFSTQITPELRRSVDKISSVINFSPYTVDSVSLVSGNAFMNFLKTHGSWELPAEIS